MNFFEKMFSPKAEAPKNEADSLVEKNEELDEVQENNENESKVENEAQIENNNEKKEAMKDTAEFREALVKGELESAENFLKEVASSPESFPNYDKRWLDHRGRELFQAFYKIQDWAGAKRVVEATEDPYSKAGRVARLEELSGLNYDEI